MTPVGGKQKKILKKEEGKLYLQSPCKSSLSIPLSRGCFSSLSLSHIHTQTLTHRQTSQSPTFPLCKLQPELRPPPIMACICHQHANHDSLGCLSPRRAVEAGLRWSFSAEACSYRPWKQEVGHFGALQTPTELADIVGFYKCTKCSSYHKTVLHVTI